MRGHDQQILGSKELRRKDSGITAHQIRDDPLQKNGNEKCDEGDAENPSPGTAGDSAQQLCQLGGEPHRVFRRWSAEIEAKKKICGCVFLKNAPWQSAPRRSRRRRTRVKHFQVVGREMVQEHPTQRAKACYTLCTYITKKPLADFLHHVQFLAWGGAVLTTLRIHTEYFGAYNYPECSAH